MITIPAIAFPTMNHFGYLTDINFEPATEIRNNEYHEEKFTIINNGIIQAKNVDVFIDKNNMNWTKSGCLEGIINDDIDTDGYLQIHFPKMSVGFECSLTFVGANNTDIGLVWISEEGRPADKWYLNKDKDELRIFWIDVLYYFFVFYGAVILIMIWLWYITPKNHQKLKSDPKFRTFLLETYGKSLKNYDEEIILAVHKGKDNYESLHEELKFNKWFIKIKVYFLYRKGIIVSKDPISLNRDVINNIN